MSRLHLFEKIKEKESFLSVGLDPDMQKIPPHLLKEEDPIFEFNKQIIDATYKFALAYKPNLAFYEAHGSKGLESLEKTMEYMPKEAFKIADAKRGDIGNTSTMYAKAFFERMNFDAITVAPYMGEDSITPFLEYPKKWVALLAATSNRGSFDFQELMIENTSEKLYETVIKKSSEWGSSNNLMYVVGATRPESLLSIRTMIPEHFLLIPGIGAQGGRLDLVLKYGMNKSVGLIVNASRSILYAGNDKDFGKDAAKAAQEIQQQMAAFLNKHFS